LTYLPPLADVVFGIWGTWDTGDEYDDMYFDYTEEDTTYSAKWYVSNSDPPGLRGYGDSEGDRIDYEE